MSFYNLLALAAATCWAITGIISARPAKHLGAVTFVRWRMSLLALLMLPLVGQFSALPPWDMGMWGGMVLSGIIGIFVGDIFLFASMNHLGPRRSGALFATHALFSALLGFMILDERLGFVAYSGAAITVIGVVIAVYFGQHKTDTHEWEAAPNSWTGIYMGLLAALSQALGALIAKPLLQAPDGFDPATAMFVRVASAVFLLWLWRYSGWYPTDNNATLNRSILLQTLVSGALGMGLGMGLLLWALQGGALGSVGVLSALSPIIILPLLWLQSGRSPALGAWLGAALACGGSALILSR